MNTTLSLPTIRNWLVFSPCAAAALVLFQGDFDGRSFSSGWLMTVLLLAPLLPLVGTLADLADFRNRAALLGGFLLLALPLLDRWTGQLLPFWLMGGIFTLLFLLTSLFHKSVLPSLPINRILKAARWDLTVVFGLPGLYLAGAYLFSGSPQYNRVAMITAVLLGLLALIVFFTSIRDKGVPDDVSWPKMTGELRAFAQPSEIVLQPKSFLVLILLTVLVWSRTLFLLADLSDNGPARFDAYVLPGLILLSMAWGAWASERMCVHFGLKRSGSLALFAGLSLLAAATLARGWELNLVVLLFSAALGVLTVLFQGILGIILPPNKAGQGFGYFYLVLVIGFGGGWLWHAHLGGMATWPMYILFSGTFLWFQSVGIYRPASSPVQSPESPASTEFDFDWSLDAPKKTGLVRHNWGSRLLDVISRAMAEVFFGRVVVTGRDRLPPNQPAILVANHPNTLLDAALVTAVAPGRLHYWAKASLWRIPLLGPVINMLGALPVYRKGRDGDDATRSEGNSRTLEAASNKLNQTAHLLIFPEGHSTPGLSLKPIKTGAARTGFHALAANGWETPIPIVPIGIDYKEPMLFRTSVAVRIGEPVMLDAYREEYEADPRGTVVAVTEEVSERLKNLLPHLEDPQLETLVRHVHELYGNRAGQILGEDDETSVRKHIVEAVNHYQRMDPDTLYLFSRRLEAFHRERQRLGTPENHPPIPKRELFKVLTEFFSFASYGLFTNWLPYRLTRRLVEWFTNSPVWTATIKLGTGAVVFGVYYLLLFWFFSSLLGPLPAAVFVVTVVLSACVALGSLERFAFRFQQLQTLWQAFWTQNTSGDLEAMRVSLIQDLERFRESYAFFKMKEGEI